jgi:hypothetical protein
LKSLQTELFIIFLALILESQPLSVLGIQVPGCQNNGMKVILAKAFVSTARTLRKEWGQLCMVSSV